MLKRALILAIFLLASAACGVDRGASAGEPTMPAPTMTSVPPASPSPEPTAVFRDAVATAVAENEEVNRFVVVRELAIEEPNENERATYERHYQGVVVAHDETLADMVLGWNIARGHTCCSPPYADFIDIFDRWLINRERFDLKVITGQLQNNGAPLDARLSISLFDSKGEHILSFDHPLNDWERDEKRYFRILVPVVPELWPDIASAELVEIDA